MNLQELLQSLSATDQKAAVAGYRLGMERAAHIAGLLYVCSGEYSGDVEWEIIHDLENTNGAK